MAYDLYAQAGDGSVWYFGEDVADIEHGAIVTKEGTWLAGKDGPAQMIMPSDPSVGDVYRTENIPGIAFEQVTVKSVDAQPQDLRPRYQFQPCAVCLPEPALYRQPNDPAQMGRQR